VRAFDETDNARAERFRRVAVGCLAQQRPTVHGYAACAKPKKRRVARRRYAAQFDEARLDLIDAAGFIPLAKQDCSRLKDARALRLVNCRQFRTCQYLPFGRLSRRAVSAPMY
jgi:hypothetical protein